MGELVEEINSAIDKLRKFLEDFYYVSTSPGCAKIGEEEFRRDMSILKHGRQPQSSETSGREGQKS